ncbi:DUF6470 family protein [Virgibacillus halodenitrificans]|uniref:YviE n=1 Tax=Virgibacillus halodenitrificans TaxID=1482 RepID=A0AAC9J416_VIRHA|nr:DUF6470 family protein [Virgibacillus halodenitrificans]APC49139.1 hypothetical protein BME96_13445 [Virgibacillus halodenitrificans]MYL44672.1 hypothetical protein [Virgibacillus halodenitrificans]MYL57495.1 hypothetical protein [Virgibacillus halodenitrificans]
MQIPQIRINSQSATIQLKTTPARQEIEQPKADLSIQQPKAKMEIRTTPSKLMIDQSQAWEQMNRMHVFKLNDRFAEEGRRGLLAGIERRAGQGRELMQIENKGNPIANQAEQNGHDGMKSLGIKFIPSHFSVKTTYQPAKVDINVKENKPEINVQPNKVIHRYKAGSVDVQMKSYSNLEIDFVNITV